MSQSYTHERLWTHTTFWVASFLKITTDTQYASTPVLHPGLPCLNFQFWGKNIVLSSTVPLRIHCITVIKIILHPRLALWLSTSSVVAFITAKIGRLNQKFKREETNQTLSRRYSTYPRACTAATYPKIIKQSPQETLKRHIRRVFYFSVKLITSRIGNRLNIRLF